MSRTLIAAAFIAAIVVIVSGVAPGQPPASKKESAGKYDPPKAPRPDAATLKRIAEKTEQLRTAIDGLKAKMVRDKILIEVEIYLKAAENIVRFEEWYSKDSGKWALTTLDQGLERARQVADRRASNTGPDFWRKTTGVWVVRAYRSRIDDSIQPYAVMMPKDYWKDLKKKWPLHVVLHGRDSSLTEAKFIATHSSGKGPPKELDHILLEVYGRGNNAYRWAGETDVFEAMEDLARVPDGSQFGANIVDDKRVVLRGFSMGGAGTWHIGLHHPDRFCVIGPGAGFTTSHGYIGNLPKKLSDYQEKCLSIYDAVDYAENAFNVPIVAYSGEKDAQKAAADNIENALKRFKEPFRFTHLIAPGLEHQMPKQWQDRAEAEYRKFSDRGRDQNPDRIRFVTYTPKYGACNWLTIHALDATYEKAVVDASRIGDVFTIATTNVRRLLLKRTAGTTRPKVSVDGQTVDLAELDSKEFPVLVLEKDKGRWRSRRHADEQARAQRPIKDSSYKGPIDDAFTAAFVTIRPSQPGWHPGTDAYSAAAIDQFAATWDRYFRGRLPSTSRRTGTRPASGANLVLFGDPQSNPLIAKAVQKLPITWTKEKLVVNGVEYDPKTCLPVLIFPNPLGGTASYVVINSGHTFKEADLKGTNALLYPRLGDWAVIKPKPTEKDPAAYEVVAAGLFNENWQFPKK